jgi:hypothetical protein
VNGWPGVMVGVVLGLLVNECTEVSPWLAHKVVRWAAVIRQPDRVDEFAEERAATINDRPGKLFKLFTALGFLFAALAHRTAKPGPTGRPSLLRVLRVRVQAAGIAGALYAVTWGLIDLFTGESPFGVTAAMGSALFVIAVVVSHLPSLRSRVALGCAVLPSALVSSLWIAADPNLPLGIATILVPVYGVAQAVRASLRDSHLLARIGSVVTTSTVITTAAVVRLETMPYDAVFPFFLGMTSLGVVGGLYVGVGLLVIEHIKKKWDTVVVTPPGANPGPAELELIGRDSRRAESPAARVRWRW